MSNCGGNANPHNANGACDTNYCETPIVQPEICCDRPRLPLPVETCPTVVHITTCGENRTVFYHSNDVNGNSMCDCLCLPEAVTFTAAQAAAIKSMLDGLLTALDPTPRCPDTCEVIPNVGHYVPLNGECCDSYDHSPFLHSGRNLGGEWTGGRPMGFTDMNALGGGNGGLASDILGKLFCCAKGVVEGAVAP